VKEISNSSARASLWNPQDTLVVVYYPPATTRTKKFTVTFSSYTGKGKPETLTNTQKRTYFAWEIAAGSLAHDKVQRGGPINFQEMEIASSDRGKINNLESVGQTLQDHWEMK